MADVSNGRRRGRLCYWHEKTAIKRNLIAMSNAVARCNENVKKTIGGNRCRITG